MEGKHPKRKRDKYNPYTIYDKVAHESKVGYTCKTKTVEKQILKDIELIKSKQIKESHWHFYRSPTTGKIGMSKPLQKFLDECCKKYNGKIHYTIEN